MVGIDPTIHSVLTGSSLPVGTISGNSASGLRCAPVRPAVENKTAEAARSILPPVLDATSVVNTDAPLKSSRTISKASLEETAEFEGNIEKFDARFSKFEESHSAWQSFFKRIESAFTNVLKFFEYADRNQRNNLDLLQRTLPEVNYEPAAATVKHVNRLFKWVDDGFHLIFNVSLFFNTKLLRDQYLVQLDQYEKLRPPKKGSPSPSIESSNTNGAVSPSSEKSMSLQHRVDQRGADLNRDYAYLKEMIGLKAAKMISKISPLGFFNLAQREASRAGGCIFSIFRSAWGISTIQKSLAIQKAWSSHLATPHHVKIANTEAASVEDGELESTPASGKKPYTEIDAFIADLQKCPTLREVNEILDLPNAPKIKNDASLKSLHQYSSAKTATFGQFQIKLQNHLLKRDVDSFLESLQRCTTLAEVKKILSAASIISIEVPQSLNRWNSLIQDPGYQSVLTESYYVATGKRPWIEDVEIRAKLVDSHEKREEKIERASTMILNHVNECQTKTFPEIVDHFKRLHIHFDTLILEEDLRESLPFPPNSHDDWQTCAASPEFCKALAGQWVDYQETLSQLVDQTSRQFLLSALSVENKFLNFHWTKYNVGILSSAVQFIFCLQYLSLQAAASILEIFVTELANLNVPGSGLLYLCYPLYPNLNFKLEAIIMLLAEHFFGIQYKPNEYSLESYKLNMQIRFVEVEEVAQYLLTTLQRIVLWLNIRLIENGVMGFKQKPLEDDSRYNELTDKYKKVCQDCENDIIAYKSRLNALRLADVKIALHPGIKDLQTNDKPFDPLENFVASFEDADFDYFSPTVLASFKANYGFDLTNTGKAQFRKRLSDFLLKKEKKLTEHFLENRTTSAA